MAKSFGCDNDSANELVQEMYVRMHKYVGSLEKVMYSENEINTYYVYVTLRNLYLSGFHKPTNKNHVPMSDSVDKEYTETNFDNEFKLKSLVEKIEGIVSDWYWYDKKMWDIHFYKNKSMRRIAKETKISLSSIFNTLSNGKEKIRQNTEKEYSIYKQTK